MWKTLLLTALSSISSFSFGQRTEFSAQTGTGLFSYRGSNSVYATGIYLMDKSLLNPYGRKSSFSYSVGGQVQHITRSKILYGIQAGYEQLTSRVDITFVIGDPGGSLPATGHATLQNQYLTFSPFLGKRFGNNRHGLDASVGMDAAVGLRSHESATGIELFQTQLSVNERDRRIPDVDFRPRINLTAYYGSFGLSAGYSYGLTNYMMNRYPIATAYSQFWRFGLAYRINK